MTKLVDDRTVVVPLPRKPAPAVPAVARATPAEAQAAPEVAPSAPVDDESTVVIPRRAVDAQIAAKTAAPAAQPQPQPQTAPTAPVSAAHTSRRAAVWIAAAAVLLVLASLVWKQTSGPIVAPIATPNGDSPLVEPTAKPANDMSGDKKTSLPVEVPAKPVIAAPQPVIPAPVIAPTTTETAAPPKTAVTESPSSSASAAKAKAAAKEKARASRANAANADGDEDNPPARRSLRPARCEVLIERFGLGETVSAADQRFFQESCK